MSKRAWIDCILISFLVMCLSSCAVGTKPPADTVKRYLDGMMIVKDPLYRGAARDELKGDPQKSKMFAEAGKTVEELMWADPSASNPERRKKLLMTLGTIVRYKSYEITGERVEGDKAYVDVVFKETAVLDKDLGNASRPESKPTTYELIKTAKGWLIKDVNGLLARAGM